MSGTDVAADVPGKFDVVIDGYGYVTAREVDPNMPFRVQQQQLNYTPTFLERTNVGQGYGDNQQDFFLTGKQNDWSLGYGQNHFVVGDPVSERKYQTGSGVYVAEAGEISSLPATVSLGSTNSILAVCAANTIGDHAFVTSGSLSTSTSTGTLTNQGAHGAGTPNQWGMCSDGNNIYIAGSTHIRRWNGSTFNEFGASITNAGSLAFLNNALYSCDGSVLKTYDTSGTPTTLFTWKDAVGTALTPLAQNPKLVPFGGKLLIYWPLLNGQPQLWVYDGTATSLLDRRPLGAVGYDVIVLDGIVFMSGTMYSAFGPQSPGSVGVIWYYANGTPGEAWRTKTVLTSGAPTLNGSPIPLGTHGGRLQFATTTGVLSQYDVATGAVTDIGTLATTANWISTSPQTIFTASTSVSGKASLFPSTNALAAAGTLTTSYFDFGNVLTKTFRGVTVDWALGGGGSGTVDIAYTIDGGASSGTIRVGATSGVEYAFPANTTGRQVSVTVTINQTGSQGGPIIKRIYVRAAPVLQSYRMNEFILDLTGAADSTGSAFVRRRDGSDHNLTGEEMRVKLAASIQSATPLSITDITGTYTGVLEPGNCEFDLVRPRQWYARIRIREV